MQANQFDYINHYKTDAEQFDYFEESTGASKHDERRVHEFINSKVPDNVNSILDIGCGSAWIASLHIPKGKTVFSFDVSKVNTNKAIDKIKDAKHSATVGDALQLPFKNNSIDCVIASEVIEHIFSPKDFVKELFRVVKPGGSLIVTTPYKEKLIYYLCIHCNKKTPLHSHIHSFDENILTSLYKGNDIYKTEWRTFGNKLLIFARTYTILRFLPFTLWLIIDKLFNLFYNSPAHIFVMYKKKSGKTT